MRPRPTPPMPSRNSERPDRRVTGCDVCHHPDRLEIDQIALTKSMPLPDICAKFGLKPWTLNRHKAKCLKRVIERQLRRVERRAGEPLLDTLIRGVESDATALRGLLQSCIANGVIGAKDTAALATALDKYNQTLCKVMEAPGFKQVSPTTNVQIAAPTQFFVLPAAPADYGPLPSAQPLPQLAGAVLEGDPD